MKTKTAAATATEAPAGFAGLTAEQIDAVLSAAAEARECSASNKGGES